MFNGLSLLYYLYTLLDNFINGTRLTAIRRRSNYNNIIY